MKNIKTEHFEQKIRTRTWKYNYISLTDYTLANNHPSLFRNARTNNITRTAAKTNKMHVSGGNSN